jgi:hypothetical protein
VTLAKTGLTLSFLFRSRDQHTVPFTLVCDFALQAVIEQQASMNVCPDLCHLPDGQRQRLRQVIASFPEVLTDKLGLTHLLEYHIQLKDNKPVRSPPYR